MRDFPVCIADIGYHESKFGVVPTNCLSNTWSQIGLLPQKIFQTNYRNFIIDGASPTFLEFARNDFIEEFLNFVFVKKFPLDPKVFDFLVSKSPLDSPTEFMLLGELLFETFQIRGLCFRDPESLALHMLKPLMLNAKSFTGIVVNCGASVTNITAVAEGYPLLRNSVSIPLAGKHIDLIFLNELRSNPKDQSSISLRAARIGKENLAYTAMNIDDYRIECMIRQEPTYYNAFKELKRTNSNFSSVKEINTMNKVFTAMVDGPEILFNKNNLRSFLKNKRSSSFTDLTLPEAVVEIIRKSPIDCRRKMYDNIFVVGGTSLIPHFKERLAHEIKELVQSSSVNEVKIGVYSIKSPIIQHYAVWSGGFRFALSEDFNRHVITAEQYDEHGCGMLGRLTVGGRWR